MKRRSRAYARDSYILYQAHFGPFLVFPQFNLTPLEIDHSQWLRHAFSGVDF